MKKRPLLASLVLLGLVLALGLLATLARAQGGPQDTLAGAPAPDVVSYQGEVWTGSPLSPYSGTGYCKFAIVDAAGTTSYWSNDGSSTGGSEPSAPVVLDVANGIFDVLLGDTTLASMTALSPAVFAGHDTYLQVWFAEDATGPYADLGRTRIAAVPYAMVVPWSGVQDVPPSLADGDQDTTYTAGDGITLTGTTFSADTDYLQRRVYQGCIPGWRVRAIHADGQVTCEPDVDTTYTAGDGITLTGTAFSADTDYLQRRVYQGCVPGWRVRAIQADGKVTCEPDVDTTYTAGDGITLTGTAFAADTDYLQRRVSGVCDPDHAVRAVAADGTVECQSVAGGTGDITAVDAGFGLSGGGAAGAVQLQVVTDTIQQRVAGECPTGASIRAIAADGTVTCEEDTDTAYGAGTGIHIADDLISAQGSPYANVIVVAKSGGDFDTIGGALAAITPTNSSRYLVWVAPGVYEEQVTMKPYVTIQGAGRDLTTITSDASSGSLEHPGASVELASFATLRDLTVLAAGTAVSTSRAAVLAYDISSAEVSNVTARGNEAVYVYGIYDYSSSLTVRDCIASAKAYTRGMGIRLRDASQVVVADTSAFGGGGDGGHGIYVSDSSATLERVSAEGDSPSLSSGIYVQYSQVTVRDSTAAASSSSLANFQSAGLREYQNHADHYTEIVDTIASGRMGMYSYCTGNPCGITNLRHSRLDGVEYGLNTYTTSGYSHTIKIDGCQLQGDTRSISLSTTELYVGASMLDGPADGTPTSNLHCSATYDAGYAALDAQCQP